MSFAIRTSLQWRCIANSEFEKLDSHGLSRASLTDAKPKCRPPTEPTEPDMTEQVKRPMFAADGVAAPLRHSAFRRIWLASLLSNLGLLIQGVGAAWAMTQMTPSADKVALVQTALMLPIMLISMPAGAIADMHDRRVVAMVALAISLTGAVALTVLAWFNMVTPNILLVFCFI